MGRQDRDAPDLKEASPGPAADDLGELLQRRTRAKRSPLTMALVAVVLVAVGAVGGILVGRSMNNSSQQAGFPGGGGFPNGGGLASGAPGGGFGGGNVTFGTIESLNGDTITVRTQSGDTVNVKVGADTQIRITKDGSIGDLSKGDTIVVGGSTSGNTVNATTISEGGVGVAGGAQPTSGG